MSNAVAAAPQTTVATTEQRQQLREFDRQLKQFRMDLADPELGVMEKLSIQADAILFIRESITPELMSKAMQLMNTPLGFKTDKTSSPFYSPDVVKNALVVALLNGAQITGNQFNIIAGQCYLTKEFYRPAILRWPGLTNFEHSLGVPMSFGSKTVAFEGFARWDLNGEVLELVFKKHETGIDNRIIVKAYESSSPDELRGKAEAKLYNRVWQRLTGLNMGSIDDDNVVEGTVTERVEAIQHEAVVTVGVDVGSGNVQAVVVETTPPKTDSQAAGEMFDAFKAQIGEMTQVSEVQDSLKANLTLISSFQWSQELIDGTRDVFTEAANDRITAIKATRGENSNKK